MAQASCTELTLLKMVMGETSCRFDRKYVVVNLNSFVEKLQNSSDSVLKSEPSELVNFYRKI